MKRRALKDLVKPVQTLDPKSGFANEFTYIDISSVDQETKRVTGARLVPSEEAPSRARQLVRAGDILVSTVRPNLNAVAAVPAELDGAIASTGFCVLRPGPDLDSGYLKHWVMTPEFVYSMVSQATGQSYPAVSDRIVKQSTLPVPSVERQRRIAAVLDQVDTLRAKRRQAVAFLDELIRSVFLDMFDTDNLEWPEMTVEELAQRNKGSIRTGPFGSQLLHEEFTDSGVPVLGIDNAVHNEFRWGERRYITETKYEQLKRYTVFPGDVLITIMGTCGRCAVVPDDIPTAINTKHLCCITLDQKKCLPEFLHSYFLMHPASRSYLTRTAKGAIMAGLNMGIIKELPVRLPPISLQQEYVNQLQQIRSSTAMHERHLAALDELFASAQHRAFSGTLWDHEAAA
jgi:type I restriction enzyme S subunit